MITAWNKAILITDSLVVQGSGHEDLAHKLAQALSSGEAQYDLDSSWGLTLILRYDQLGFDAPYYENDPFWAVYTGGISTGDQSQLLKISNHYKAFSQHGSGHHPKG